MRAMFSCVATCYDCPGPLDPCSVAPSPRASLVARRELPRASRSHPTSHPAPKDIRDDRINSSAEAGGLGKGINPRG